MTPPVLDAPRTLWCADLLDRLRREGFDVGIGQWLQIERLLDRTGPPAATGDLATLIGPIVARDPEEQRRFHELFAEYIAAVPVDPEEPAGDEPRRRQSVRTKTVELEPPPPVPWWRHRGLWVAVVTALLVVVALVVSLGPPVEIVTPPDTTTPRESTGTPPLSGLAELETLAPLQGAASGPAHEPSTRLPLRLAAGALPLTLFGLYEWRRHRRRRAVAERADVARAPFVWPIRIPNAAAGLFAPADLAATARALRRRQRSSEVAFAVEPTIRATIQALGFPSARFDPVTRPAEYLALIERSTSRDHQAHYFAALTQRLALEGAFITQYFFEHDPRVCFQPGMLRGIRLADLARQREGDRLLVFSDGYSFLDPVRGNPLPWIELLDGWRDRALLTPVEPRRWGAREAVLKRHFAILPPTLDGLRAAADAFDTGTRPDLSRWKERDRSLPAPPDGPDVTPSDLRTALADDGLFRWLCATAVYPELHWDLTARLGDLGEVGARTLTERNVLRMVRLRWFRDGIMPNDLRRALLDELALIDRGTGLDTEQAARQALANLIERDPVEPESVAGQLQRKELLQQRLYLYRDDPPVRRDALAAIRARVPEDEILQDVTVVRLLTRSLPNRLALALPAWLREAIWPGGHQALGTRRAVSAAAAVILATGGWLAFPDPKEPSGLRSIPLAIVPDLRAALLPPNGSAAFSVTVLDSAGRPEAAPVTFGSSPAGVVTVDTSGAEPTIRAGRAGSGVVTVTRGAGSVAVPIRVRADSDAVLLLASARFPLGTLVRVPSRGVVRAAAASSANRQQSANPPGWSGWVSCNPAIVEVKPPTFGETDGVAEGRQAGSAVLVRKGPGSWLVRVLHVTSESKNPLVAEIERPIDPYPANGADRILAGLTAKAAAIDSVFRTDRTARVRVMAELLRGASMRSSDNDASWSGLSLPSVSAIRSQLESLGVPSARIETQTRVGGPDCGGSPAPVGATGGLADRIDFVVIRDSVRETATFAVTPAALDLSAGEVRRLQPALGSAAVDPEKVSWMTTQPLVATVDRGLVLARSAGTTVITARYLRYTTTTTVTVRVVNASATPPADIVLTLAPSSMRLTVGDSGLIQGKVTTKSPARGDNQLSWSSNAPRVAQVAGGMVRAIAPGKARITATVRGTVTGSAQVTVDPAKNDVAAGAVRVPTLKGLDPDQATVNLLKLGLEVAVDTVQALSCTVRPVPEVIGSSPDAGQLVSAGARVKLSVLPIREDRVAVPNLVGRTISVARSLITDACLTLGKVDSTGGRTSPAQQQYNQAPNQAARPAGIAVVAQTPAPGATVRLRALVDLVVAGGSSTDDKSLKDNRAFLDRAMKALMPNWKFDELVVLSEMQKGMSRSEAIIAIIGEPLFAKFDRPDAWIGAVVQLVLCRKVDVKEIDSFRADIKKLGDDGFVRQLIASPEARAKRVSCLGERLTASAK